MRARRCSQAFDRLGWDAAAGEPADRTLLRSRLIGALGDVRQTKPIINEAKRRFALFVEGPGLAAPRFARNGHGTLSAAMRTAPPTIPFWRSAASTTNTAERVRYYGAAASARDEALAKETLAITLTDELPTTLVGT